MAKKSWDRWSVFFPTSYAGFPALLYTPLIINFFEVL
jgi:hypothetical protein